MKKEMYSHLTGSLIPFWKNLRDNEYGGYYGFLSNDLILDKKAVKGCILANRILWFFSNAYTLLKDESVLNEAKHSFEFVKNHCIDKEYGGCFWMVTYDGKPEDTMKHTYNQAFCIYALSSYYEASGDNEALKMAMDIFHIIEAKCVNEFGYVEAFDRSFGPISNEALSTNGVIAEKTMNTVLHVMEAYTELYRVSHNQEVKEKLNNILNTVIVNLFNPEKERLEVLFDNEYNSLIDLHSYGHDIEASWLMDRAVQVLGDTPHKEKIAYISNVLAKKIYDRAFDGHSVLNECENGVDNLHRIWWIQAESVVGFLNAYQKDKTKEHYLKASEDIWEFIKNNVVDKRPGSEWFWEVDGNGVPYTEHAMVEPWKCPYHNGRMCIEVIRRLTKEETK